MIELGSRGYMLNPEATAMMPMVVRTRVKAIVVRGRPQYHWNKTFEPLEKLFACKYFTKVRLDQNLPFPSPWAQLCQDYTKKSGLILNLRLSLLAQLPEKP